MSVLVIMGRNGARVKSQIWMEEFGTTDEHRKTLMKKENAEAKTENAKKKQIPHPDETKAGVRNDRRGRAGRKAGAGVAGARRNLPELCQAAPCSRSNFSTRSLSAGVSTLTASESVLTTPMWKPFSSHRSCSSCSMRSSSPGGSVGNSRSASRRKAYRPICFQWRAATVVLLSRTQGIGAREKYRPL